mgnify:CR=1 FL=1
MREELLYARKGEQEADKRRKPGTDFYLRIRIFVAVGDDVVRYLHKPYLIGHDKALRYLKILYPFRKGVKKDEEIFLTQKYFRGQNAKEKEGSGMGMYIAEYLVKGMGGRLLCRSEENAWFEVRIWLGSAFCNCWSLSLRKSWKMKFFRQV